MLVQLPEWITPRVSRQNKILELDLLLFTRVDHWPKYLKYKISENSEIVFLSNLA